MKMDFLKDNSNTSTMRVVVFLTCIGAVVLLFATSFNIAFNTVKHFDIDWAQIAVLLGGVTALLTGVLYTKVQQKKIEDQHETNQT